MALQFRRTLLAGGAAAALLTVSPTPAVSRSRPEKEPAPVRARYVITAADDFIVDVFHNGKPVPDAKRSLLEERHGATVERIDLEVRRGDWLVFNVVNNRIRWGGVYYFAAAGCLAPNEFGFQSRLDSGDWSYCDNPKDVDRFIAERSHLRHRSALPVKQPWDNGTPYMRRFAGGGWDGQPVWGAARNTWIKVLVD